MERFRDPLLFLCECESAAPRCKRASVAALRTATAIGLFLITSGAAMAADLTPNAVDEDWYAVAFPDGYVVNAPVVAASMQTYNGSNPAGLRIRDVSAGGFEVFVEEEQSADSELAHPNEVVGYAVFEQGPITNIEGKVIGEAGRLSRSQGNGDQWRTITLGHTYADPVVVMNITTYNGSDPAHIRIGEVSRASFKWQIEEWDYLDGGKNKETMDYLVFDSGIHVLPDGRVIEAGVVRADDDWTRVDLFAGFGVTPVVLSQSQTYNGAQAIVTRQRKATSEGFEVRVQEEEGNNGSHTYEAVGYIAVTVGFPILQSGGIAQSDALFASGFEDGVSIVPVYNRHELSGIDSLTGDDWADLKLFESQKFHYSTAGDAPDDWVTTEIVDMPGHDGSTTRALHMAVHGDAPGSGLTRNEMQFMPPADFTQGYVRYRLRFQDDLLDNLPVDGANWRLFMELKEPDSGNGLTNRQCGSADAGGSNNWRLNVAINRDSVTDQPQWRMKTEQVQPCRETDAIIENKVTPIPAGEWFQVEAFYRKGDAANGRFWMAINGEELFDFRGRTQHATNPLPVQFWSVVKLYNSREWWDNGSTEQWVDDLEVFADFPDRHPAR